jgi:hypothetical protein
MRLKFGDPESINLRDKMIVDEIKKKIIDKVKCPFCKAKATEIYEYDIKQKYLCWNFDCKPDCPNSLEYAEKTGFWEDAETTTDLNGKFIDD